MPWEKDMLIPWSPRGTPSPLLQDLCKDVNFDCSEKGIEVQCMDSSHVALVSLLLRECAFSEFKCDRAVSLGMNIDSLTKILKMTGDTQK